MRVLSTCLVVLMLIPLVIGQTTTVKPPTDNQSHFDRKCMMCKFSVSLVNYALRTKKGSSEVDKIATNFCVAAQLESPLVCSQVGKLFNHEITKVLSYGIVTPNQICGYLYNNTCGHFHNPLDDWEVNLNASTGLNPYEIEKLRQQAVDNKEPQTQAVYRIIHISDTHVDLKYREGSPSLCLEPFCCQTTSTATNESLAKAGYWGTYGLCDLPLRTFEATVKKLNETIKQLGNVEYIIWTGDIQPHDIWAQSKNSAIEIYDAIFAKIFEYLPDIKILPTFGNHEMIPVDSFSPSNMLNIAGDDSPRWLYKKLDSFWSRWLPVDTVDTIMRDGFYAATIRKGLKVISLNTNFCHSKNFWLYINSTDPGNQLQWLVHELQISELLHEKVHIIGHIPPGAEDCLRVWSKNYHRILRRFASTITGQFFGHTHNSEFEIFYNNNEKVSKKLKLLVMGDEKVADGDQANDDSWSPIAVGFIGSSVTTFVDLNPSFTIHNIDPSRGYMSVDLENHFMNLTHANLNTTREPEWTSVGSFSKRMGITDTSPTSLHNLLLDIARGLQSYENSHNLPASTSTTSNDTNHLIDERLFELYRIYNSFSDKFTKISFDKISLADKRKFICRFFTAQAHDFSACDRFIPKSNSTDLEIP